MKRVIALLAAVLAVSPCFAQKGAVPGASSTDTGDKYVALMEQMANIIDADKANCDKMGADLDAWLSKNSAEIERMHDIGQRQTPEQRAEFRKKYGARLGAAETKMRPGLMNCSQNAKVKTAISKMRTNHP